MKLPTPRFLLRVGAVILGIGLLAVMGRTLASYLPSVAAWVKEFGPLAPIAFIAVCALAEVAFVPGSLLTITAGVIFGLGWGATYAFVGATFGSVIAFLMARHMVRRPVEKWLAKSSRLRAFDAALEHDGLKAVFLVRLTPLIPFNALNYALGVTRIRFRDYLLGSIGMLPGSLLYAYYGRVIGDMARVAAGAAPPRGTGYYLMLIVGLVATAALGAVLARIARRALAIPNPASTE